MPAPRGLNSRGRAFWKAVTERYEMNPAEALILHELCRVADELDRVDSELKIAGELVVNGSTGQPRAHPLLAVRVELEKTADVLSRRLALPDDRLAVKRSNNAAQAGKARWSRGA
ncbi:hypothetical protein [Mycobacterium sp. 852002-50816_SCH5313054-b]|uniref:hypothetical protein n=1 Tax=Mycobacterium sp. 852002-50816_SCH5313054-b TaxID=1834092 RepID=UPI0012E9F1A0|nr:hypothetical protein [Mycobacterium sp. 852002-50816_SCH5313054-b]